jgi:hypothetical protein
MRSFFFFLVLLVTSQAFQQVRPVTRSAFSSSTELNVFGNKKSAAARKESEADSAMWQGEWVCKDCGYIYNRVRRGTVYCVLCILYER